MFYITYLERTSKSKKLIVYKERINIFNMKKIKIAWMTMTVIGLKSRSQAPRCCGPH